MERQDKIINQLENKRKMVLEFIGDETIEVIFAHYLLHKI